MTHLRKAMLEELQRRNLSQITIRIYLRAVEEFAQYFKMSPDRLRPDHIRDGIEIDSCVGLRGTI